MLKTTLIHKNQSSQLLEDVIQLHKVAEDFCSNIILPKNIKDDLQKSEKIFDKKITILEKV